MLTVPVTIPNMPGRGALYRFHPRSLLNESRGFRDARCYLQFPSSYRALERADDIGFRDVVTIRARGRFVPTGEPDFNRVQPLTPEHIGNGLAYSGCVDNESWGGFAPSPQFGIEPPDDPHLFDIIRPNWESVKIRHFNPRLSGRPCPERWYERVAQVVRNLEPFELVDNRYRRVVLQFSQIDTQKR